MNHRKQRVADQVHQILARLINEELRDPRVGFITVTDVRLSSDLRHARVYVSFLEKRPEIPLAALRKAAPFLRTRLAREANLRHAPELRFDIDAAMVDGFRVEEILEQIGSEERVSDDAAPDGAAPDAGDRGP